MKKKLLLVLFGFLAIGLLCGLAFADTNPDDNYDDELGTGTVVDVTLCETYYDDCYWSNVFAGSKGWSQDTWVLTTSGGGIEINCYDRFWYGDFYSVWLVDTAKGAVICRIFTTPEVETDDHHVCATNPYHTGKGTVWSDATYPKFFAAGTYEFKVRNEFMHVLWAEGIDPTTPQPWSPSGFYIHFIDAPHVIPDVPLGTVLSAVTMIGAFVAFAGIRVRQRH